MQATALTGLRGNYNFRLYFLLFELLALYRKQFVLNSHCQVDSFLMEKPRQQFSIGDVPFKLFLVGFK